MTDKKLGELLSIFHQIETLLVKHGARDKNDDDTPTSFSEKIKSFDCFEAEPPDPGDIGYKFYYKNDTYHIKDQYEYEYDSDIEDELDSYIEYKTWKKHYWEYRNQILDGNYYTLKKIGHERNQLMHIYGYEIQNLNRFIKVCRSMISYLENPQKIKFLHHKKFKENDKSIFYDTPVKEKEIKLAFGERSKWLMLDSMLNILWSRRAAFVMILALCILVGIYKLVEYTCGQYKLSMSSSIFLWVFLQIILYYFSIVLTSLQKLFYMTIKMPIQLYKLVALLLEKLYKLLYDFFEAVIEIIFEGLVSLWWSLFPFLIIAAVVYYMLLSPSNSFSALDSPNKQSMIDKQISNVNFGNMHKSTIDAKQEFKSVALTEKKQRVVEILQSCQYYYVQSKTLNVRAGNSTKSHIVDKIYQNNKLCIVKKDSSWYYVKNKGWVYGRHIARKKVKIKNSRYTKKHQKSKKSVWHCVAKSKRASGWVERVGKQNSIKGALQQCEKRRVSSQKCQLVNCYKL